MIKTKFMNAKNILFQFVFLLYLTWNTDYRDETAASIDIRSINLTSRFLALSIESCR